MLIKILIACLGALSLVGTAHAAEPSTAKPLLFSDLGGVQSWRRGDKDTVVYVQGQDKFWYRVDMYETCMKFLNDKGIRFVTEEDEFGERISRVVVDRYICRVLEINKVDAPPPRQDAQ